MAGHEPPGAAEVRLPAKGRTAEEVAALLANARRADADWRRGRLTGLVYFAGDDVLRVAEEAYLAYFSENALGPRAFPSVKRFEEEVVHMAAHLFHAPGAFGNVSSGGTESILLALKTARDYARARRPQVCVPEVIVPASAHPAFNKAAHSFGLRVIRTPLRADFRADLPALAAAITEQTILLVGSAPAYPYGVVDPIAEIAQLAQEHGLLCHVDACVGGFQLPFLRKLGHAVPDFDFSVPGVTSLSADLHKYGFTAKGASVILYRDAELYAHQWFAFRDWPRGLYRTPTLLGTRPAGAIAAAWAVLQYLGEEGYVRLTKKVMDLTQTLVAGISALPGLEVFGRPETSVFSYGSRTLNMAAVADGMEARGWYINRLASPPGIHVLVTPVHEPAIASYLADLRAVAGLLAAGTGESQGTEVTYA